MVFYTKSEIIRGIREKDNRIVLWLYHEVLPGLEDYVKRNGGTVHDAKDLFQDALIVIFNKIREDDFEPSVNIPHYIFGTCRKMWLQRITRKKETKNYEQTEDAGGSLPPGMYEDPDPPVDAGEIKRALYVKHLSSLGLECREILRLVYQGISLQEISRLLDHPNVKYTYNKKNMCLANLIRKIRNDPDNPYRDRE